MRIRTRFVAALAVLAVVLSLLSLAGFSLYREAILAQEQADLVRMSEAIATQLDVVLTERRQTVSLWSSRPSLGNHGSDAQAAALQSFVSSTEFSGASVVAANGTMTAIYTNGTADSGADDLVGQSFADSTYVQRALAGETYVSDPIDAESGNRIVTISTPIWEGDEIVGTFNAAFHLGEGDLIGSVEARSTSTAGINVAAGDETIHSTGVEPTDDLAVATANATVEQTGWTVAVTQSQHAVDSRLRTVTLFQAGTLALVVVSLGAFGSWLFREYVANFERLQDGFAALVDGEYGTNVALSGSTEWTVLGNQFNELSETLARRQVGATVLNRVLRHNLYNAMTVVSGNADRIVEQADDETVVTEAEMIRDRSESLLTLADHARIVESSLRADRSESPARPVATVVEETVGILAEEYPDARVENGSLPEGVWIPEGDRVAVAVDELVRNAVVHADGDPHVSLDVRADDSTVSIAVSDDGPGLPAVERRLLTERFVETPTQHGSGLGLWLVKWIVESVDGDVAATVDDGTTVTIRVPRTPPPE